MISLYAICKVIYIVIAICVIFYTARIVTGSNKLYTFWHMFTAFAFPLLVGIFWLPLIIIWLILSWKELVHMLSDRE